jgi:hypothetical protein
VRVGPERDVFLKHGLLIKENYIKLISVTSANIPKKNPAISVKTSKAWTLNQISKKVSIRDTNKKNYPVFI